MSHEKIIDTQDYIHGVVAAALEGLKTFDVPGNVSFEIRFRDAVFGASNVIAFPSAVFPAVGRRPRLFARAAAEMRDGYFFA